VEDIFKVFKENDPPAFARRRDVNPQPPYGLAYHRPKGGARTLQLGVTSLRHLQSVEDISDISKVVKTSPKCRRHLGTVQPPEASSSKDTPQPHLIHRTKNILHWLPSTLLAPSMGFIRL
jgi:hypothetical protein